MAINWVLWQFSSALGGTSMVSCSTAILAVDRKEVGSFVEKQSKLSKSPEDRLDQMATLLPCVLIADRRLGPLMLD